MFLGSGGSLSGDFEKINKSVGVASGACAQGQLCNIRLSVDLLVVCSSCHGHLVCMAQCTHETGQHGYQVPYSGEVYVGTDFRGSPTTPGRFFNNFNEIHPLFFFLPVYRVEKLLSKKHVINLVWPKKDAETPYSICTITPRLYNYT